MNALIIKDPADLLSFIGHTLGFWPQESLVCITLDKGKVGATLRIDLPRQPGTELSYARTVSSYLTSDTQASSIVFALYTSQPCQPGQPKPHAAIIAALTGVLAENGITIRDGIFVSDDTYSPYDSGPGQDISLPISTTEYSRVNAEFIYRGSTIEPTNRIILPTPTGEADHAIAVENRMRTIRAQAPHQAALQASGLWTTMLERNDFPTDEDCVMLIANFQFPHIRDRLMADIPGIDEPPQHILFAQTAASPKWSRVEWAQQLLLHAYTRTSPQHAAPILTTIGYINWWEGRGSKAHQWDCPGFC
ncbi:DUF4192 family protein [Paenarthrobacter nitroguajacolicus]|uniref:DUF4192 family protein n=1 Tax=Paenarthrobacter nitroguajacolicus TaxID=211146 RepID=UPI0015B8DEAC|nr:DUF4192 family protein [Paenarthrobacter nitroguajacolicus]NWL32729.1 DUF4192 domain-containing protein [Paenarthrobacter nitroguajacolicus]